MSHGSDQGGAGIHTTSIRIGRSRWEPLECWVETDCVESTEVWSSPLWYSWGRPPQLSQEWSWTNDAHQQQVWHRAWLVWKGCSLGCCTSWKPAATAAATTVAETAYGLHFDRRHTRLPANHHWARSHTRWRIQPIGIEHTWQIRWQRSIVGFAANTMILNRYLRKLTFYWETLASRISKPSGELLP